ncbi:mercury(II) reductase [Thermomicrobiaceae bacterium CFH 74404]|uniref:Mercuric reductase n=1 Tax=Thermalbibacter longus TaxID=2951981 RepID=A0AA42B9B7_9BACT|nr:mercury(II) reductase [Thermalbibacter longus]MCM8747977.1 mercury(II) reductase [Thermalbibacter longus]
MKKQARAYRMAIDGMTCSHCEETVERALRAQGAQGVRADWRHGEVTFTLVDGVDLSTLRSAVRATGYRPGEVTEQPSPERAPITFSSSEADTDLVIIGGGSAAFSAAITATELGARVIMIEEGTIGGTCVNVGCVPSKFLLRAAEVYHEAGHHGYAGVQTAALGVELDRLVAQKRELSGELRREKYEELIEYYGWELIRGRARFIGPDAVAVGDRVVRARAFLIATGARPTVPAIPGLEEAGYLTSTSAMELDRPPSSLGVIGAGYVALELGQVVRSLGSEVTLVQRRPRLLPDYEPEVAEAMGAALGRLGTTVLTGSRVLRVERTRQGRRLVVLRDGREEMLEVEQILVAAGRRPNTEGLDLERAGVAVDERGVPVLDEALRTTNPRVWVAGDVTLAPQFVYVAAYQGRLAARNAVLDLEEPADLSAVPGVIFTDPQVATVGLTRAEAGRQGYRVESAFVPAQAIARARVDLAPEGGVVMVTDGESGRVLGVQAIGRHAGEMIYAATLAVKHRLTAGDLVESFAPYLTMAEGLRLAALAFERDVAKLSCCA